MIWTILKTIASIRLESGIWWSRRRGWHWTACGLFRLYFEVPRDRYDVPVNIHFPVFRREYMKWGYDPEGVWYDGPHPEFGLGPLAFVCWYEHWPFPPRGFEPGEQPIEFYAGARPKSFKCPVCQGVTTITLDFVFDLVKSVPYRGLVFCCHCREWVHDCVWMRNGIETAERVGEQITDQV